MQEGAQYFVGKQDFASVRSQGTPVKSTVRTIFWCEVEPVGRTLRVLALGAYPFLQRGMQYLVY